MDAAQESCQSGTLGFVWQPELTLVEGKRTTDDVFCNRIEKETSESIHLKPLKT